MTGIGAYIPGRWHEPDTVSKAGLGRRMFHFWGFMAVGKKPGWALLIGFVPTEF